MIRVPERERGGKERENHMSQTHIKKSFSQTRELIKQVVVSKKFS